MAKPSTTDIPPCPAHLKGIARTQWNKLCRLVKESHGLTDADLLLIELAAIAYEHYRHAQTKIKQLGIVVDDEVANPWCAELHKFYADYLRCLADLKLTRRGHTPKPQAVPLPTNIPTVAEQSHVISLEQYRGRVQVS